MQGGALAAFVLARILAIALPLLRARRESHPPCAAGLDQFFCHEPLPSFFKECYVGELPTGRIRVIRLRRRYLTYLWVAQAPIRPNKIPLERRLRTWHWFNNKVLA